MEFQMRNKTFISSMVGVAAAVAVAGSANAAITPVVLDSFSSAYSGSQTVNGTGSPANPISGFDFSSWGTIAGQTPDKSLAGSAPAGSPQPPQTYAYNYVTQSSGIVTYKVDLTGTTSDLLAPTVYGNISSNFRYGNTGGTAPAAFNWNSYTSGGMTHFYFDDVTQDAAKGKMRVTVNVAGTSFSAAITDAGVQVGNRWFVAFASLKDGSNNGLTTSNLSAFRNLSVGFALTSNLAAGQTAQGSMSEFGVVPAPGALALLGVAGIVGARRRRA
jgi:hypothetical protein